MLLAACSSSSSPSSDSSTKANQSGASAAPFPVTITDAAGQKLTFDKPVRKIGCYWSGCDEGLADLGVTPWASSNIQGEADSNNKPSTLVYSGGLPKMDTTKLGGEDNPESWAAAGVDLIVTRRPASATMNAFKKVAPVLYLYAPGSAPGTDDTSQYHGVAAYEQNLRLLGAITGQTEAASQAIKRFDTFVTKLATKAPTSAATTTVALIFQSNDGTYTLYGGPTLPFCAVLTQYRLGSCADPGGRNAASWQINAEAFLALNPDWIIYMGGQDGASTDWRKRSDPTWTKLSAVTNKQVLNDFDAREYCCSLRALAPTLQLYAYTVWGGASSGVANPGPVADYRYDDKSSPIAGS